MAGLFVFLVMAAACDKTPATTSEKSPAPVTVVEAWLTEPDEAANIDSVAVHPGEDGATWLFATAKVGDVVRIFDASTGRHLRDLGSAGDGAGEFRRPNGIIALDGILLVVERDNHRIQAFSLPALTPLLAFGDEHLARPYGAYLRRLDGDQYRLYVTDNYETADGNVPPASELGRRIQTFVIDVVRAEDGTVKAMAAEHDAPLGETSGPGKLNIVESIWGDPAYDRLLVAEEDPADDRVLKVYTLEGVFSGVVGEGVFRVQPEGIALFACADGSGYWIATDQDMENNVFHLFNRRTLEHVGAFRGQVTRNTDGIGLAQSPFGNFAAGALFAVHDDQSVAAFDWGAIAAAVGVVAACEVD
jgi:3-phytase